MREKNKIKIVLSLLIAVAFLLPASSVIATESTVEKKASALQKGHIGAFEVVSDNKPLISLDEDDGCYPVDVTEISIGGEYYETGDILRTGTYPLDVEICQTMYDPCVGLWTLITTDLIMEVPAVSGDVLQPLEVYMMTDGVDVFVRFNNLGNSVGIGVIYIKLTGDVTATYFFPGPSGNDVTVDFPLPPCCNDVIFTYEVFSLDQTGVNVGPYGGFEIPFGDIYPATVKKFIDVYKLVEHPGEYTDDEVVDLYCEDFEDPCEINTNWATIDQPTFGANGALDTWTWSDKRYCSAGHSMHSTSFDEYLPNQLDILQMIVPINVAAYDEVNIEFCMWIEGDAINIGNETVPVMVIQDYGKFEYSFDGATWINPDGLYYDSNGVAVTVDFDIMLDDSSILDNNLYVRFVWYADAAFCYEGMYIDDVCFTGTIYGETIHEPWDEWVWIHDSYDGPITFDEECIVNVFPDVWVADEEGIYLICAWLEAIDECHTTTTNVTEKFCIEIEIGDVLDNELVCESLEVTPPSPAWEGDDIVSTIQVCNVGTLDETNKQVRMIAQRGSFEEIYSTSFETGTGLLPRPTTWSSLPDQWVANLASQPTRSWSRYSTYDSSDGNVAIAWFNDTLPHPYSYTGDFGVYSGSWVRGPVLWTGTDTSRGIKVSFDMKFNLEPGDTFKVGIMSVESGSSWIGGWGGYTDWANYEMDISGDFLPGALEYGSTHPGVFDPDHHYAPVFWISFDIDGIMGGDAGCPWNSEWFGAMLDNILITDLIAEEEIIFEQTQIIPVLNSGDCVDLTFTWPDAGVGSYVFTYEIITPDSNPDNNKCRSAYQIINVIECIDEWECVDYSGPGQGHWVEESCCGGYFWPGDPATTMYGNNWDDSIYLKNATGGLNFDLTAAGVASIDFDTWYQISAGDYGMVEYSKDGGMIWWPLVSYTGTSVGDPFGWFHATLAVPGTDTATMQFRFRFKSNATGVNRGWFVDNIRLTNGTTTVFGPDPCLDFTKFYRHETQFGCWWNQPWIESYADQLGCLDYNHPVYGWLHWAYSPTLGAYLIPYAAWEPSWGVYDPTIWVPGIYNTFYSRPFMGPYPDNLNTAIIGTIDTPTAFYGWLSVAAYYDMYDAGDNGYLEVSNDGVNWDVLKTYHGCYDIDTYGGYYSLGSKLRNDLVYFDGTPEAVRVWLTGNAPPRQYDMTPYLDDAQINVRFRMTSDAQNLWKVAGFGIFGPICFYGMEDNNAPVTTAQMTGTFDEDCHWYTSCVKIKLDATDDITGVAHTYYTLDGVQYEYTQLVSICTDGTHEFCYWSVDNEGNVEEKKCLPEFRIDMTGPTVDITGPSPGLYLFGNKIMEPKSGKTIFLFNGIPVTATATAADNPVEVVQFYLDDVLMAEDSTAPYSATLSAKHTGPATIKVVAIDGQGRTATDTLNIDNYFKLF